jgi:hypothetical protein
MTVKKTGARKQLLKNQHPEKQGRRRLRQQGGIEGTCQLRLCGRHNIFMRWTIRFARLSAGTLLANLKQIESSWCPLNI